MGARTDNGRDLIRIGKRWMNNESAQTLFYFNARMFTHVRGGYSAIKEQLCKIPFTVLGDLKRCFAVVLCRVLIGLECDYSFIPFNVKRAKVMKKECLACVLPKGCYRLTFVQFGFVVV